MIGADVKVGENSEINRSVIGDGCRIGANVFIEDSYVWAGAIVEDGARLTGAIVASRAMAKTPAGVPQEVCKKSMCDGLIRLVVSLRLIAPGIQPWSFST